MFANPRSCELRMLKKQDAFINVWKIPHVLDPRASDAHYTRTNADRAIENVAFEHPLRPKCLYRVVVRWKTELTEAARERALIRVLDNAERAGYPIGDPTTPVKGTDRAY